MDILLHRLWREQVMRPGLVLATFGLLWLAMGGGCTTSVCRSHSDCQTALPWCVLAQCKACRNDGDCGGKRCDPARGECVASSAELPASEVAQEPPEESLAEPALEPVAELPVELSVERAPDEPARPPDASELVTPDTTPDLVLEEACQPGDTRACYTGDKGTVGKGVCIAGTQTCDASGQWGSCEGEKTPSTEACDGLDNDCDGLVDEICGPAHTFALISHLGAINRQRNVVSVTRADTGRYTIETRTSCVNDPMFAAVFDERRYQGAGISCASDGKFDVGIVQRTPAGVASYTDSSFYVVVPLRTPGEIFATVDGTRCVQDNNKCAVSTAHGQAEVRHIDTGVFEIIASVCTAGQPIFLSSINQLAQRALVAEINGGKCYARIFDDKGRPINEQFSFWLPDRKTNAFAFFDSTGVLKDKNDFGDQSARWTVTATSMGAFTRYSVAFPAWLDPSAVLVTSLRLSPKQLGVYPMATDLQIFPFNIKGPTDPEGTSNVSVLFVQ